MVFYQFYKKIFRSESDTILLMRGGCYGIHVNDIDYWGSQTYCSAV